MDWFGVCGGGCLFSDVAWTGEVSLGGRMGREGYVFVGWGSWGWEVAPVEEIQRDSKERYRGILRGDRETYVLESSRQADHKAPKKSHYYPTRNRNQNADVEESD